MQTSGGGEGDSASVECLFSGFRFQGLGFSLPAVTVLISGVATHPRAAPRSPMDRDTPWLSPLDENILSSHQGH